MRCVVEMSPKYFAQQRCRKQGEGEQETTQAEAPYSLAQLAGVAGLHGSGGGLGGGFVK